MIVCLFTWTDCFPKWLIYFQNFGFFVKKSLIEDRRPKNWRWNMRKLLCCLFCIVAQRSRILFIDVNWWLVFALAIKNSCQTIFLIFLHFNLELVEKLKNLSSVRHHWRDHWPGSLTGYSCHPILPIFLYFNLKLVEKLKKLSSVRLHWRDHCQQFSWYVRIKLLNTIDWICSVKQFESDKHF